MAAATMPIPVPIRMAAFTVDTNGSDFTYGGSGFQGLWFDAETGQWYQRARYNHSSLGRFGQRDPIVYAGGTMNLYQPYGGNPVKRVDPSGLYEQDFHYNVIYHLFRAKCWDKKSAETIAFWSQYMDESIHTEPLANSVNYEKNSHNHFPGSDESTATVANDPKARGAAQVAIDAYVTGRTGAEGMMSIGTKLHIFADSFSHAGFTAYHSDAINRRTGGLRPNVGHADAPQGGHAPDRPYNNSAAALAAAKAIYDLIPEMCCNGRTATSWSSLSTRLLAVFNVQSDDVSRRATIIDLTIPGAWLPPTPFGRNTSAQMVTKDNVPVMDYFKAFYGNKSSLQPKEVPHDVGFHSLRG